VRGAISRPSIPNILAQSLYCLYGLLVVTGLRISEALKLRDQDIDFEAGILTVESSKFGKSRWVPLHPTTVTELKHYQDIRKEHFDTNTGHFFSNQFGKPIGYDSVRYHFKKIFKSMGRADQSGRSGPTLHSLRHFFAISTITQWYEAGEDVQSKLPILSTFLGHVETRDTYWYISACPSLMLAATQRLESSQGVQR
jgi:integrase/recombinase XerD